VSQQIDGKQLRSQYSYVSLFREPRRLLVSGFLHMREQPACCYDWGFTPTDRAHDFKSISQASIQHHIGLRNMSLREYTLTPGALGCQARMLLGYQCHAGRPLTADEVSTAVSIVHERLLFVGLQEKWQLSVCLWHARFGGPLTRIELLNSRRGDADAGQSLAMPASRSDAHPSRSSTARLAYEAPVDTYDFADEAVYLAAKARFFRDVELHNRSVTSCMRAIANQAISEGLATTALHGQHCVPPIHSDGGRVCYRF